MSKLTLFLLGCLILKNIHNIINYTIFMFQNPYPQLSISASLGSSTPNLVFCSQNLERKKKRSCTRRRGGWSSCRIPAMLLTSTRVNRHRHLPCSTAAELKPPPSTWHWQPTVIHSAAAGGAAPVRAIPLVPYSRPRPHTVCLKLGCRSGAGRRRLPPRPDA